MDNDIDRSITHKMAVSISRGIRTKIQKSSIKSETGKILPEICKRNEIEIIEAEACPDHIHMLISIQPKISVSKAMGYSKAKVA